MPKTRPPYLSVVAFTQLFDIVETVMVLVSIRPWSPSTVSTRLMTVSLNQACSYFVTNSFTSSCSEP